MVFFATWNPQTSEHEARERQQIKGVHFPLMLKGERIREMKKHRNERGALIGGAYMCWGALIGGSYMCWN